MAVCHDRAPWLVYHVAYCDSCHGHSCPVSCLAVPHIQWPREIPDFTNFTDYKLSSLLCCLKSHLSIFSSFYLSCITPILPGFCLLLHTSSVFFLSSCCSKISICCHHPILHSHSGVSGSSLSLFLSPSHSMQTGLLSCSLSSVTPGLTPITALLWLQLCLLLFPHFPGFGFSLLLFIEKSRIRKRFIFSISECNSGAGRGGESAPGSSWKRGRVSPRQQLPPCGTARVWSRAEQHCGACALQPVSAWECQARECGAEHAGMPR